MNARLKTICLSVPLSVACNSPVKGEPVPHLVHQGVVAVQGERFTGDGAFRFALVNPDTDDYLWTNDGSAVTHPDAPTDPVTLTVINGVYNVQLGDEDLTNMTDIPDEVFATNDNVALRIWFDDQQEHGTHRLTPDVDITPSPFAQRAKRSDALAVPDSTDLAVTADAEGNVSVQSGNLTVENGNATISGNLTVHGQFTNFSVTGPATVSRTIVGSSFANLTDVDNSFCTLTGQTIDVNAFAIDNASCRIQSIGGSWRLIASLTGNIGGNGEVTCEAHCFVFEEDE